MIATEYASVCRSLMLALCGILFVGVSVYRKPAVSAEPPITDVVFSANGKTLLTCSQSGIRVLKYPSLRLERELDTDIGNVHAIAFSPDAKSLAVAGGMPSETGTVQIYSWPELQRFGQLRNKHDDCVMGIAWINNQTIAAAALDHRVTVWDTEKGECQLVLSGHSRGVSSVSFVARGSLLVSAGADTSLRVWELESGQQKRNMSIHTRPVHALALRPGDWKLPMIASASDDTSVRFWQPTIGRMVRFTKVKAKPLAIDWMPDGSLIAAAYSDGHVRFIDPNTVEVVKERAMIDGWAYCLAVHPSGRSLVAGGTSGQLKTMAIKLEQ